MTLLKLSAAIAIALSLPMSAPLSAQQSERVRVNTPTAGQDEKVYRNSAMVTGYDARQTVSRQASRMVTEGFKRKLFHVSRETGLDAGTPVFFDKGDWWCTQRDNYYAGGGRFGKLCLRDKDRDGAFERVRMNRGLLMRTLDPPVPHSEVQAQSEQVPVGLKKVLVYRGYEQNRLLVDYIEYVKFESDPAVTRPATVALMGGTGRVTIQGVTFDILRASEHSLEYRIVAGTL